MFTKTATAATFLVLVAGCTTVELPIAPVDQRPASYPDPAPVMAPSVDNLESGKEVDTGVVVHAVTTAQPTVRRLELPPVRSAAIPPSAPSTTGLSSAGASTGGVSSAGSSPLNAASGQSSGSSSTLNGAPTDGVTIMKPKAVPDESVSSNKPAAVETTPEGFAVPARPPR